MPTWDTDLRGVHREVAADPGRLLHVLAGPGTGKTFAMMRRVARLLEEDVSPDKILVVSFTRTAARDLREQLEQLGPPGACDVRATTLHALCFSILGTQQAFNFTLRTPRPLLSYEIDCLEADLAGQFGGKKKTNRLLQAYEAAWARLQHDVPGYAPTEAERRFEAALLTWLRFYRAMLIGELVPLTLHFLRANPALNAAPEFDHVLVDEFQDLNKADQSLVHLLTGESSLLVIGDDNQSIYRFRHANPEGIRTFPEEFPGTVPYTIEQCRRCPPNIVNISNALIAHDPNTSRPTPLQPDRTKPDATIWVVQHATLEEEVSNVTDYVDYYLTANPELNPGRVLILTPRRFIGNAIKDRIIARGYNALSYFQEDVIASLDAAEGFCLLNLLINPADRPAIRAWLGFGAGDCRCRPMQRLKKYCEESEGDMIDVLNGLASGAITIPHTAPLIDRWQTLQRRLFELADLEGVALVDALWPQEAAEAIDIRSIAATIALDKSAPEEILEELRTAITQPELPGSDSDIIQVMSLHKSKGLTRDLVILAGCMAGTLPFIDDKDPPAIQRASLEEQRRLFYVAITRATKVLVISSAASLPIADAFRGGAKVVTRSFTAGVPYARTAFTPFLAELGNDAPTPVTGAQWRAQIGLPLGQI